MPVRILVWMVGLLLMVGCGSKRPVLYPNEHLKSVGEEVARKDMENCYTLADEAGAQGDAAAELAARTGKSAVIGGATGAVAGAISGAAGQGSLIGAAAGGTAALISGLFQAKQPDPLFMRFVERCLFEKGYLVLGWR